MATIPVMRPRLPTAERLVPYLKKIDAAQIYSNYGPPSALCAGGAAGGTWAHAAISVPFYRDLAPPNIQRIADVILSANAI